VNSVLKAVFICVQFICVAATLVASVVWSGVCLQSFRKTLCEFSQMEACFWRHRSSSCQALRALVHVLVFHSSRLLVCPLALTVRYATTCSRHGTISVVSLSLKYQVYW